MKNQRDIRPTTLFTDIGGVMLTNGWDREARKKAVQEFDLDPVETEERHHLTFDTYESGKITLEEYLNRLVFYTARKFTHAHFRQFMFDQSEPFPEMIELVRKTKEKYNLKLAVVNNEGRELNTHRIEKFKLNEFVDFFVSSCFVHFRKPDADIFKVALDIAQVPPDEVIYLEDRALFVQVAAGLGIRGIVHTDVQSTKTALEQYNLG